MNERSVVQYTKSMEKVREWSSIHEAQEAYNISHISSVCRGERRSDGGFVWRYAALPPEDVRGGEDKEKERIAAGIQEILLSDAVKSDKDQDEKQVNAAGGSRSQRKNRIKK